MLKRLMQASVWARGGVRPEDYRYRGIYRFVLPVTDLLFFYFGAVGWHNGIRTVREAAGAEWQTWWSAGIALTALVALVGVSFPKLWPVEVVGKIFLITLVTQYILLTLGRGVLDDKITAVAGLMVILILTPIWRVADLGFEAWKSARRGPHG